MKYIKMMFIKLQSKNIKNFMGAGLTNQEIKKLTGLFDDLDQSPALYKPSKYWIELNKMNMNQLSMHGYECFKRTIALNYFTFVRIMPFDPQIVFLVKNLPFKIVLHCFFDSFKCKRHDFFSIFNFIESILYNFLTLASWSYVSKTVKDEDLLSLSEPDFGDPAKIYSEKKLISQDLANSCLEVNSIKIAAKELFKKSNKKKTVLELGAGYGRDAYVFLSSNSNVRYIIVDIPPAIYVSQKYLSSIFPELNIFSYRRFENFKDIEKDFYKADIVFLLPFQLPKIPAETIDLILTISSLHEMKHNQISNYLNQFNRLLRLNGFVYIKQWFSGAVLFEDITINKKDYPIPEGWEIIFDRAAHIHTSFFESFYKKINPR
ncbi:putative sugar O-methyltransferase [Candidatus Methylopumilus planktonicus]|uniref:putative sugar O-methyltransferase n=1 Tax=Candidatus Methylopumilus planktonicus TaxID=1581557 RepID=UPI003D18DABD